MPTKRKVVCADELALPKPIQVRDFDELCETLRIPREQRHTLKDELDELVKVFASWMGEERGHPDRSSDEDFLKDALSQIEAAKSAASRLGPSGGQALRITSRLFGYMITAQWLNDKFPDDDYAPRRIAAPHHAAGSGRLPIRRSSRMEHREEFFIEEYTLDDRRRFVRNRAVQVMSAILASIEEGLRQSLQDIKRQPGSRGGRKPIKFRRYLLINLARMWISLGRDVSTGPKSDFFTFCESVAELIGWPSGGIAADIPRALRDLRNRTR
jgi:hypothetical protein